ncbi:ATP-binding protein [Aliifodinibius sp. S!AR15-10]|uniref:ATP-binding protein n=1 Tax=Aliifodinibius sp. S!AR15-10 TaxID=2950437 RepID=UPI00285AB154|nr:ATP-binding protein [Aliifodinibius sp. S!AR15-10]MDR8392842.1 ATP-binding protein [Aliifodinibius sp. S!AR15-10]
MRKTISVLGIAMTDNDNNTIIQALNQLNRSGFEPRYQITKTAKQMEEALDAKSWDIILCALHPPAFDDISALQIARHHKPKLPFILVRDEISLEDTLTFINKGACECLDKQNLKKLPAVINRELRTRRELQKAKEVRIENKWLAECSPNEIYLFEPGSQKIAFTNKQALQNLGYSKQELKHISLSKLYPDFSPTVFAKLLEPVRNGSCPELSLCTLHRRKDGSRYPVEIHFHPVHQNGMFILAGIARDISDLKKHVTTSLRKSKYLASITHEMRTSLNSITMFCNLLNSSSEDLNQQQWEYTETIAKASHSMLELMNQVLDQSAIQSGQKKIKLEEICVQDIFGHLEQAFAPLARENDITLEFHIRPDCRQTLKTDHLFLKKVLKNFLSNALKFTQEGTVTVTCYSPGATELADLNVDNRHQQNIAFSVEDTGMGIPEEKQQIIFETFRQADGSIHESYGGSGLGLALCQEIAELLDGALHLESEAGQGSVFTFYLPAGTGNTSMNGTQKTKGTSYSSKSSPSLHVASTPDSNLNQTVLLVDDNEMHNLALKEYLGLKIKTCLTANTAREAYEILEKDFIDCVILDMDLPDTSGYELIVNINTEPKYADPLSIIYTGEHISQKKELKLQQHTDGIVYKKAGSYKLLINKITSLLGETTLRTGD